jgi:uncharacterized protein YjiS (DUF1127 family)
MGTIDTKRVVSTWSGKIIAADMGILWRNLADAARLIRNRVALACFKHKSRQTLRNLTREQLRDIGISQYEALREANRPFWD